MARLGGRRDGACFGTLAHAPRGAGFDDRTCPTRWRRRAHRRSGRPASPAPAGLPRKGAKKLEDREGRRPKPYGSRRPASPAPPGQGESRGDKKGGKDRRIGPAAHRVEWRDGPEGVRAAGCALEGGAAPVLDPLAGDAVQGRGNRARAVLHEHGDARPPPSGAGGAHARPRGVDARALHPDGARQAGPSLGSQEGVGSMRPVPDACHGACRRRMGSDPPAGRMRR